MIRNHSIRRSAALFMNAEMGSAIEVKIQKIYGATLTEKVDIQIGMVQAFQALLIEILGE